MDQRDNQVNLLPSSSNIHIKEQSPRKAAHGGSGGVDRIKRDEWSEGAVNALLEAYESKWVLRNRAKLKGQDWEDVARHVSSRGLSSSSSNHHTTKSPKTQTQCKNKIESMKKRYRLESAATASSSGHHNNSSHGGSSWPLYTRLDRLLRGSGGVSSAVSGSSSPLLTYAVPPVVVSSPVGGDSSDIKNPGLVLVESGPVVPPQTLPPPSVPATTTPPPGIQLEQRSSQSNDDPDKLAKEEDGVHPEEEAKAPPDQLSDRNILDTDSASTPALYRSDNNRASKRTTRSPTESKPPKLVGMKRKRRRRRGDNQEVDIAESIQWLAEAMVRSEHARMETVRELERMRVEAELKRGEMDLKRTEIIANTQLEIARLFAYSRPEDGGGGAAAAGNNNSVDSSLRIGRS